MEFDEFRDLVAEARRRYASTFEALPFDAAAKADDLSRVEAAIGVSLPEKYRALLREYGGGAMGFVEIYSADASSEVYFPDRVAAASQYLPVGWLPFSEDGCGGVYVLRVEGGVAGETVHYYDHEDGSVRGTRYADVLEYVGETGLESSSDRRLRETNRDGRGRSLAEE